MFTIEYRRSPRRSKKQQTEQDKCWLKRNAVILCVRFFLKLIRNNFIAPIGLDGKPTPNYPPANYALNLYQGALTRGNVSKATTHQVDANTIGVTNSQTFVVQWNAAFYGLSLDEQAQHTIHESLHQEPTFDDNTLARAASLVAYGKEPGPSDLSSVSAASKYLNSILFQYCH